MTVDPGVTVGAAHDLAHHAEEHLLGVCCVGRAAQWVMVPNVTLLDQMLW